MLVAVVHHQVPIDLRPGILVQIVDKVNGILTTILMIFLTMSVYLILHI